MDHNTAEYDEGERLNDDECIDEIFYTIESLLSLKGSEEYSIMTDSQNLQITDDNFAQSIMYERQNIAEQFGIREVFTLLLVSFGPDQSFEERALTISLENTQFDLNTNKVNHNINLTYTPKLNKFLNEALEMLREEQQKEIDIWNEKI